MIFDGPPPEDIVHLGDGTVVWRCECGAAGISSSEAWARSDVNRHRQREHERSLR